MRRLAASHQHPFRAFSMPTSHSPRIGISRGVGTLVRGSGLTSSPTDLHWWSPREEWGQQAREGLWEPAGPCTLGVSPPRLLLSFGMEGRRREHRSFTEPASQDHCTRRDGILTCAIKIITPHKNVRYAFTIVLPDT